MRLNRIRDYDDDAATVIATMPAPPIVIGHSMGGFVTQHLMARGVALRGAGPLASVPHAGVLPVALKTLRRGPLNFLRLNLFLSLWPMVADRDAAAHLFLDTDTAPSELAAFQARPTDESYLAFLDMLASTRWRWPCRANPPTRRRSASLAARSTRSSRRPPNSASPLALPPRPISCRMRRTT